MNGSYTRLILKCGGLTLTIFFLSGCASIAAYQVGRRDCRTPSPPTVTEMGVDRDNLYIAFKCNLNKRNALGLDGVSVGQGAAIAKVRINDLFRFTTMAVPVEFSRRRRWFHSYKRIPVSTGIPTADQPCQFVTGSSPDLLIHSYCGANKGTTTLRGIFDQTANGFSYRTIWGYALLPVVMPLALAVDVVSSPFYAFGLASIHGKAISDRHFMNRGRNSELIALDWRNDEPSDRAATVR